MSFVDMHAQRRIQLTAGREEPRVGNAQHVLGDGGDLGGRPRRHGRLAVDAHYNGLALDASEGERIARAMGNADVVFLANHGVVVCGPRMAHAYDDLYYLERACQAQVLALSTGRPLAPVDAALAARVAAQTLGERLQSELFFEALRRTA